MTMTETLYAPADAHVSPLDSSACRGYLAWLFGEKDAVEPEGSSGLNWMLAHCDDGVTWGRYDAGPRVWRQSHQVAPEVSPPIRSESLHELRFFGESAEVLIWRTEAGLRGRIIRDTNASIEFEESRILLGTQVLEQLDHDFTRVSDGTGAEQVVPLVVSDDQLRDGRVRLVVRHYYESDTETGVVRIVATRLVRLTTGGADGA
jgi:CRISPR-associated protein (TIGR03984 family)